MYILQYLNLKFSKVLLVPFQFSNFQKLNWTHYDRFYGWKQMSVDLPAYENWSLKFYLFRYRWSPVRAAFWKPGIQHLLQEMIWLFYLVWNHKIKVVLWRLFDLKNKDVQDTVNHEFFFNDDGCLCFINDDGLVCHHINFN